MIGNFVNLNDDKIKSNVGKVIELFEHGVKVNKNKKILDFKDIYPVQINTEWLHWIDFTYMKSSDEYIHNEFGYIVVKKCLNPNGFFKWFIFLKKTLDDKNPQKLFEVKSINSIQNFINNF